MGVIVGCQPSWDASISSGYPTFLSAYKKKKDKLENIFFKKRKKARGYE